MYKKYICLILSLTIIIMYCIPVSAGSASTPPSPEHLQWGIQAAKLQKWQSLDPEEESKKRLRAKLIIGGLVGILAASRAPSDDGSYSETDFLLDFAIGSGLAYLIKPYSKKKMYAEKNQWQQLHQQGISKKYINPFTAAGKEIEIKDVVKPNSTGIIVLETMGGAFGPFLLFGKAITMVPKRPEMAILLLPSIALWPLSVPYGVYAIGKSKHQGAKYRNALLGSIMAMLVAYFGYNPSETSEYEDFTDYYYGSMEFYGSSVILSVLTYNLLKPKSCIDIQYGQSIVSPSLYIANGKHGTNPSVNLQILQFQF